MSKMIESSQSYSNGHSSFSFFIEPAVMDDEACEFARAVIKNACLSGTGKGRKKGVRRSPPYLCCIKVLAN